MTKKNQSRAAKMVLASLLAVSLSVPTFAGVTSANTEEAAVTVSAQVAKTVAVQTFKTGTSDLEPAISSHLAPEGKIVEKDGKLEAHVTVLAKSAPMIAGFQTKSGTEFADATETKNEDGTITYSFPFVAGEALESKIHVFAPEFKMDKWYPFDLKMDEAKAEEEEQEEQAPVKRAIVKVYKDGTNKESVMQDYVESTVTIAKSPKGHLVTMTIKEGQEQYINGFKVNETEAVKAEKDGKRTYTFEVADATKLVNAELHVIVDVAGVNYDSNHKVQLGFDTNPFSDIEKDGNKEAILALFDKGIVKGNAKFNPANNINRSQFALMIYRALEMEPVPNTGFKDISNLPDKELVNAINALAEAGIVQKADKFNPTNTLTRSQGALMLYRAVNHATGSVVDSGDASLSYYVDGETIKDLETKKAFGFLYNNDIMTGSPTADGKKAINAASSLTRSQMAKILNGSLNFINQK